MAVEVVLPGQLGFAFGPPREGCCGKREADPKMVWVSASRSFEEGEPSEEENRGTNQHLYQYFQAVGGGPFRDILSSRLCEINPLLDFALRGPVAPTRSQLEKTVEVARFLMMAFVRQRISEDFGARIRSEASIEGAPLKFPQREVLLKKKLNVEEFERVGRVIQEEMKDRGVYAPETARRLYLVACEVLKRSPDLVQLDQMVGQSYRLFREPVDPFEGGKAVVLSEEEMWCLAEKAAVSLSAVYEGGSIDAALISRVFTVISRVLNRTPTAEQLGRMQGWVLALKGEGLVKEMLVRKVEEWRAKYEIPPPLRPLPKTAA